MVPFTSLMDTSISICSVLIIFFAMLDLRVHFPPTISSKRSQYLFPSCAGFTRMLKLMASVRKKLPYDMVGWRLRAVDTGGRMHLADGVAGTARLQPMTPCHVDLHSGFAGLCRALLWHCTGAGTLGLGLEDCSQCTLARCTAHTMLYTSHYSLHDGNCSFVAQNTLVICTGYLHRILLHRILL